MKLYMFRTVPLSIIRSLFAVHLVMIYVIQVCRQLSSRTRMERQLCVRFADAAASRKLDTQPTAPHQTNNL